MSATAEHLAWFEKAEHDLLSIANNVETAQRVRAAILERVPQAGAS